MLCHFLGKVWHFRGFGLSFGGCSRGPGREGVPRSCQGLPEKCHDAAECCQTLFGPCRRSARLCLRNATICQRTAKPFSGCGPRCDENAIICHDSTTKWQRSARPSSDCATILTTIATILPKPAEEMPRSARELPNSAAPPDLSAASAVPVAAHKCLRSPRDVGQRTDKKRHDSDIASEQPVHFLAISVRSLSSAPHSAADREGLAAACGQEADRGRHDPDKKRAQNGQAFFGARQESDRMRHDPDRERPESGHARFGRDRIRTEKATIRTRSRQRTDRPFPGCATNRTATATERTENGQDSPQNGQEADRLRGTAHPLSSLRGAGRGASIGLRCRSARPWWQSAPPSTLTRHLAVLIASPSIRAQPQRRASAAAPARCPEHRAPPSAAAAVAARPGAAVACAAAPAPRSRTAKCRDPRAIGSELRLHAAHHAQRPGPGLLPAAPRPGAELISEASARRALERSSRVLPLRGARLLQGRNDASRRYGCAVLRGAHHGQRA